MTDALRRFERLAAEFYHATGMLAPGKDEPAAAYRGESFEAERWRIWREWLSARRRSACIGTHHKNCRPRACVCEFRH